MANNTFNFKETIDQVNKVINDLPKQMATQMKDDSVKNIKNGGFYGDKWEPAKDNDHPLLQKSGNLLNAVQKSVNYGNKSGKDGYKLNVVNDYGLFHNEGTATLPKREFMGNSQQLDMELTKIITMKLDKAFTLK